MNKNLDLLKKLINDTKNNKVDWIKFPPPKNNWYSLRDYWKGEMNLTKDKKLTFTLNYSVDNFSSSELNVYFIKENERSMIWNVEPGIFSFRTENNLKKLIKLINKKEIDKKPEPIGPPKPDDFKEIVY